MPSWFPNWLTGKPHRNHDSHHEFQERLTTHKLLRGLIEIEPETISTNTSRFILLHQLFVIISIILRVILSPFFNPLAEHIPGKRCNRASKHLTTLAVVRCIVEVDAAHSKLLLFLTIRTWLTATKWEIENTLSLAGWAHWSFA